MASDQSAAYSMDQVRWNDKYTATQYAAGKEPIALIRNVFSILPQKGRVLDLAMGEGRNGVFLAERGYAVEGIDISDVGLQNARRLAKERGVSIATQTADLEKYVLPKNTYDIIIVAYYLQFTLYKQIPASLKPGGFVIAETFHEDHGKYAPKFNRDYLLKKNELLHAFSDMKVIQYRYHDSGQAVTASIVAQKC